MRILSIFIALFALISCKKNYEDNVDTVSEIIEFQDHTSSLFSIAYDILSNIDSAISTKMFAQGTNLYWVDSLFSDNTGIEVYIQFTDYDKFNEKYLYGMDKKLRNGMLHLVVDNSINNEEIKGSINTVDSIGYFSGYYFKKMRKINGTLSFNRLNANDWQISVSKMKYKNETTEAEMNFEGNIRLDNNTLNDLWGSTLFLTGNSQGNFKSDFKSVIDKALTLQYSSSCSGMFRKGTQEIMLGKQGWVVDYNAFGNTNCDRYIKLINGRKEFFQKMY
ncbi:MAG: hypothetical protein J5I91_08290 [Bacteroidetes bacterium]|nr:hypothetical protein [Bacteroidota bacterium]